MSSTHGCAHRRQGYPERLRRIRFKESKTGKTLAFLTNHFGIRALSVYALCKSRREVELFFERIKQHLRIKRFFGTSGNAVMSRIWIAVVTYVLVAIVKKPLDLSLHAMLQIPSVTPFEKARLSQLLADWAPADESPDAVISRYYGETCRTLLVRNI